MDNLTVIDNELVPVYITDKGEKVVNGRELHSALQSKQDFSTWVKKRLNECDAKENKDFVRFHEKMEGNNATMIEYIILLDTGKEMAMLERNAKGKQVRRYFIKVDEKYKEEKSTPLTLQQQIQTIAKGTEELYQRVDEVTEEVKTVKQEIESLKLDLPILPIEADKITEAVRKKGVAVLGGKQSNAYSNRGLRQKLYNNLYANLKYNFGVKSYKSIKRSQCDKAIEVIQRYEPPFFLSQQIESVNAQQTLGLEGGVHHG